MSRYDNRAPWIGPLRWVLIVSLAGTGLMLILAAVMRSLGDVRLQILLTLVALCLGSLLMQVQLRARVHTRGGISALLTLGVAVILISQVSFLILVWTNWRTATVVWRLWWISMVPSVFVTHLILIQRAAERRGGILELLTAFCALWAGLMILYLGLRKDMLAGISPAYLWVGAVPAGGTVLGSVWAVMRRSLRHARPGVASKRATVAGVLMSHLVVALGAFYIGRATIRRASELSRDPNAAVSAAPGDVRRQFDKDAYGVQSKVATYLGDTKIVNRPPLIRVEQIKALQGRLRPGDILLERRNWYLSNPWLPGFWPHAALYVGRPEDLQRLGLTDHPAVRKHLVAYLAPARDKRPNTVIEAVSEGVMLNSLTHSLHADYVAVLRPRADARQIATAIARAFENLGRPYDFNFDFDDTSRLVCTQLVHVAYQGALDFRLVRVLGRRTLPANEIARKYAAEATSPARQLDFVLFLDAAPARGVAFEATERAFRASVNRPRALVESP